MENEEAERKKNRLHNIIKAHITVLKNDPEDDTIEYLEKNEYLKKSELAGVRRQSVGACSRK